MRSRVHERVHLVHHVRGCRAVRRREAQDDQRRGYPVCDDDARIRHVRRGPQGLPRQIQGPSLATFVLHPLTNAAGEYGNLTEDFLSTHRSTSTRRARTRRDGLPASAPPQPRLSSERLALLLLLLLPPMKMPRSTPAMATSSLTMRISTSEEVKTTTRKSKTSAHDDSSLPRFLLYRLP